MMICHITGNKSLSVAVSDRYWDWYIFIKHASEIVALVSQLVISTAIKNYSGYRPLPTTMPQLQESGLRAQKTNRY
jgi:hypothetical protein